MSGAWGTSQTLPSPQCGPLTRSPFAVLSCFVTQNVCVGLYSHWPRCFGCCLPCRSFLLSASLSCLWPEDGGAANTKAKLVRAESELLVEHPRHFTLMELESCSLSGTSCVCSLPEREGQPCNKHVLVEGPSRWEGPYLLYTKKR